MGMLHGDEAIAYAEQVGRQVWRRGSGEDAEGLGLADAKALPDQQREQVFISLAYSGYVVTEQEEVLLAIAADNAFGFSLTDGDEQWPGGIGKAKQMRPIRPSQVPEDLREKLDPLRS